MTREHVVGNILLEGTSPKDVKKIFERATPKAIDEMIEKYPYHEIGRHEIDDYTSAIAAMTIGDEIKERFYRRWKQETFDNGHDSDIPDDELLTMKYKGHSIKYVKGRDVFWCAQCEEPITVQKGDLKRYCDECEEPLEALTGPYRFFDFTSGHKATFIPRKLGEHVLDEEHLITVVKEGSDPTRGKSYIWKGNHYSPHGETILRDIIQKHLKDEWRKNRRDETLDYIKEQTCESGKILNEQHYLIALENTGYDLRKNEPVDLDPSQHYNTIQLDIKYDPDAQCPKFKEYMESLLPEAERKTMLEAIGYTLIKKDVLNKTIFCLGQGSNGRSTLFELIQEILNGQTTNVKLHELIEDFKVSDIEDQLLCINAECSEKTITDTSKWKELSGGDTILINPKYRKPRSIRPLINQIYAFNSLPRIEDRTRSVYRRLVLVDFPYNFTSHEKLVDEFDNYKLKDPDVIEELKNDEEEHSGIFNLVTEHLQDLLERGEFFTEKSEEEKRKMYELESRPLKKFLEECCEFKEGTYIEKELFTRAYKRWARAQKKTLYSKEQIGKQEEMEDIETGQVNHEGRRPRTWKHIKFTDEFKQEYNINELIDDGDYAYQSV